MLIKFYNQLRPMESDPSKFCLFQAQGIMVDAPATWISYERISAHSLKSSMLFSWELSNVEITMN
jgi:hypothetical protein